MPELRQVQYQQMDQKCPSCGNGWMRPTGIVTSQTPPQYAHRCTSCAYEAVYGMRFPYVVQ
jgi:hypothetical protein